MVHISVMIKESLEYLALSNGDKVIDATAGNGGHTYVLARAVGTKGSVLAIERDSVLANALCVGIVHKKLHQNIVVVNSNYRFMDDICAEEGFDKVNGVLFDLGFSSWHIDKSGRGFSFLDDSPLDMRYDTTNEDSLTAFDVVNSYSVPDLERIFLEYGEENRYKELARAIFKARKKNKIETTSALVSIIDSVVKSRGKIHPATKIFQAIRIEVNDELNALHEGLGQAMRNTKSDGRIVVISFHSLEDRIVKNTFTKWKKEMKGNILTKKVVTPQYSEILHNRRSRSAKLRAFHII